jgi:hypothetical protein
LRNGFTGAAAPVTMRVNTAAPPEPLVLGALTQRSATLAIGEVRRYAFDLTRGQLLALRMSTTTGLRGTAQIDGGNIYNGYVTCRRRTRRPATAARLRATKRGGCAVALLHRHAAGRGRRTVALDIEAPTPTPAALGELLSLQLPPKTLVDWRYDIVTAGRYLLCWSYVGGVDTQAATAGPRRRVGPVARFTNYGGDLGGGGQGTAVETIGTLTAGTNTLTLWSDSLGTCSVGGTAGGARAGGGARRRRGRQRQHRALRASLLHLRRGRSARPTRCA